MNLIFLHGAPGVGKRTVAQELSEALGFPFLNTHHLGELLEPVFGYGSENFNGLRDDVFTRLVTAATDLPEEGLIISFIYDTAFSPDIFSPFIDAAREHGSTALFIGLTCDDDELQARADETGHGTEIRGTQASLADLPGPSITINTSGESAAETVENILMLLPNDLKKRQLDML